MKAVRKGTKYNKALYHYKNHYLNKKLENLDESSTRIIINHLLSDVLGYKELEDIKIEFPIEGGYIDYLIELKHKKLIVVEAKSIKTKLSHKHLRQATYYAAIVGVKWIILTNGRDLELYKINYTKPIKVKLLFTLDLSKLDNNSKLLMSYISKRSVSNGELDKYSKVHDTVSSLGF